MKSAVTGRVVWIYKGRSKKPSYMAYCRAKKQELARVRGWRRIVNQRKNNILRFLAALTKTNAIPEEVSAEMSAAQRNIVSMANTAPVCDKGFYEHIIRERSRRKRRWFCSQYDTNDTPLR